MAKGAAKRCALPVAVALLSAASMAQLGRNWAFVVGVGDYESEAVSPIPFAVADAKAVADALMRNGYSADSVVLMTSDVESGNLRPTNVNILERLEALSVQIQPQDSFFFYYAGHGITREGRHFLATTNTRLSTLATLDVSTLSVEALANALKNIQAQRAVFLYDAFKGSPDRNREQYDNLLTPSFQQSLMAASRSLSFGNAGVGFMVANAQGERSYDAAMRNHSVFAYYVVEALSGAAFSQGEALSFATFAAYVQSGVRTWSDENLTTRSRSQIPTFQIVGAPRVNFGTSSGGTGIPPIRQPDPNQGTRPPVRNGRARVQFSTTPEGAQITVNDVQIGGRVTPFEFELNLGDAGVQDITVVATLEGYETATKVVTVRANEPADIHIELTRTGGGGTTNPTTPTGNLFLTRKVNVGDDFVYTINSESTSQGAKLVFTGTDTQRVTRVSPDGTYTVESTVTAATVKLNQQEPVPIPEQPPTTTTYAADGTIQSIQSAAVASPYRYALMTMFIAPDKDVKRGDKWTRDFSADQQRGTVGSRVEFTVDRMERINGVECYKIRVNYRETAGQRPATASGFIWISQADGWLVRSDLDLKNAPSDGNVGQLDIKVRVERTR